VESGGNGNWYRYVPSISIFTWFSFDNARGAALASTHQGLRGYLATVTSAEEQDFINRSFEYLLGFGATGSAWLGASDAAVEGQWRWLDGPEAGQLVGYTNWLQSHPVHQPGFEDFDVLALGILAVSPPTVYGWYTLTPADGALGYIVEYGSGSTPPIPEPATGAMLAAGLAALGWVARRRRRSA
jgi:Lectin C-type domain/PEP-CTERM motif